MPLPHFSDICFYHSSFLNTSVKNAGEVINEKDKCLQCRGNKITQEKKVLEVQVEKGMRHGQKIVFEGQADQAVSEIAFRWAISLRILGFPVLSIGLQKGCFFGISSFTFCLWNFAGSFK